MLISVTAGVVAGCGSQGLPRGSGGVARAPAAEPAVAPRAHARPAGESVRVGAAPEGIVAVPRAGLVVVAVRSPAQLVLFDARTGRVVRRVGILAPARHLALASPGGPVLVPAERAGVLLELSLPVGELRSVDVGVHPHDAAAVAERILVANEFGHSVSVIDGGREVARVGRFLQPGGVAEVQGDAAVVDVGGDTVTLINARRLSVIGRAPAGEGPTHVVSDRGRLFVVDTRGNAILAYSTRPVLRQLGRVGLPGTPYGVAIDGVRQRLWVTLTARNQLAELETSDASLRLLGTYPTARQPNTVAVDPSDGEVFVADAGAGIVQLVTPKR